MKQPRILVSVFLLFATITFTPTPEPTNALVGWCGAAGSPYIGSAAIQPMDINVSNNAGISSRSSVAVNSHGQPCIAWMDSTAGTTDIFYTRWNGTNWVNASGAAMTLANSNVSNNSGGSTYPQLKLDSSDNPCISWTDSTPGNTEIFFARWNGASWVTANGTVLDTTNGNVSNDTNTSQSSTLALDASGNPHLAWCNWMTTNYEIIYTKWNGSAWVNASGTAMTVSNSNVSNDTENNYSPSLDLDSTGIPWIGWYNTTVGNYEIMLGRWNGSSWVSTTDAPLTVASGNISNNAGISFEPCVKIDSSNRPCVAWYDNTPGNNEIYFARWNGANWVTANGSLLGATNANVSNSSGDANLPRLALDSSDNPHIVWYDDTMSPGTNDIYYVRWDGTNWVNGAGITATTANTNVSNTSTRSYFAALALDSSDNPHIVWDQFSPTVSDIYYITWAVNFDGSFALTKSVDTNADGDFSDSGKTIIAGDTLTYKINWQFNQGQDPLENPYLYDTVPAGTTYVTGGASPTTNLSYSLDGGVTWTAGEPPNGSPAGTRLRWDLSSLWVNATGITVDSTNPNVSNNTGVSDFPSLAMDQNGNPCIAWSDDVSGATLVYYARWNGTEWVNAAGLPFTVANGSTAGIRGGDPTLALDPVTGNPWIAFQSNAILFSNLEIHILKWDGSQWTNAAGTTATLLNTDVSNNTGLSWFPSHQLALDSNRFPCFVWKDNTTGSWQSYFARWNGANWTNVSGAVLTATNGSIGNGIVDPSFWPTLVLDGNDNPCIAWDSNVTGNSEVYFAKWNGSQWVNVFGTPLTPTNGNISNNSGSSLIPYLAIDRLTGNPCIVWSDDTPGNYEIYFAKWNGSAWVNANGNVLNATNGNMSNNSGNSSLLSIALDSNGLPCISWEDDTSGNSEICYAKWNGAQWVNSYNSPLTSTNGIINVSPARSWFPSVAIDPITGNPNIAWLDRTPGNNEVYFAKWIGYSQTFPFTFSVQVDNPPTSVAFCNTATFRHRYDNGIATESNEVCNTIDYDFSGTFTLDKSVDANGDGKYTDNGATVDPGTTLSYKIDWFFNNPNNDPLFGAYIYDQIPAGTKYIAGSATTGDLYHSLDSGATWTAGEPTDGAQPGTRLRWRAFSAGWVGAANSRYNGSNLPLPYDINVTNGIMDSRDPIISLDSNNRPHFVWIGSDTSTWQTDVFYGKWDGTQWVNAAGLPLTFANSNITNDNLFEDNASLVIDENDLPNIAWDTENGSNRKIAFARWDGTQWVNADGTPYSFAGSSVTDPSDNSVWPSIDVDSGNRPCISWVGNSSSQVIKFTRWNGSAWVTAQGTALTASNGDLAPGCTNWQYSPNLKMNSQDNPCISLQEFDINTNLTQIMYASWNGSAWINTSSQTYSFDNWNVSRLPGSSYVPSLQLDSSDRPCIAWEYSFNWDYDIYFTRWDGSQWTDASGTTYTPGTNGNVSYPSNMSITPDLELDPSGNPCLSWIDNGTGTDQAYFVRWNGTSWTTADGRVSDSTNPNVSNAPSHIYNPNLAIDSNGNPHMVWSGMASLNPEGPRDVIYVNYKPAGRTQYFGVKVDNPFLNMNLSPICNVATFSHAFDKGNPAVSNSACVVLKSTKEEKSNLVVRKVAKSMQYTPTDTFEFKITISNTGNLAAQNVVLVDNFPNEFVFVSSQPSGQAGLSGVRFAIGTLASKASETFSLKFKLSSKVNIDDCILVTNEAIATSSTQVVKDTAIIRICSPHAENPLLLDVKWTGIDKQNIAKSGTLVIASIKTIGGTAPFDISIDWGDGSNDAGVINKSEDMFTKEHVYSSTGSYEITITCRDKYSSTKILRKKITVQ